MRVIAGSAKGVRLATRQGDAVTRPTGDRVKEALFGSIQFGLQGARVLDVFAGSGALGIEALSRGAAEAVFIDADRAAVSCIRENLRAARLTEQAVVLEGDFAAGICRAQGAFDYVFLDPPYAAGLYQAAAAALIESGRLAEGALVIAEHSGSVRLEGFRLLRERRYGKTYLAFFETGAESI